MYRMRCLATLLLSPVLCTCLLAQDKTATKAKTGVAKDVDPLALDVLKAVAEPVEHAETYSFRALVSEEQLASNGQIVTFFHTVDVRVQRPDKVHLIFQGRGARVDFYRANGSITMFAPDEKFYTTIPAKPTIDEDLTALAAKGVDLPIGPFLNSHLYELASKSLITG